MKHILNFKIFESSGNKCEVEIKLSWTGKYYTITALNSISHDEWMSLGDNLSKKNIEINDEIEKKYNIKRTEKQLRYPTDVSFSNYNYATGKGSWSASTKVDVKNWLELHDDKVYTNSKI
jgi:hypothetical protein